VDVGFPAQVHYGEEEIAELFFEIGVAFVHDWRTGWGAAWWIGFEKVRGFF
jgi:hypothetical protein